MSHGMEKPGKPQNKNSNKMKKAMCLIVLIMLGMIETSCEKDRKVLFDYQNISAPDHEDLDSLGMADFFNHARIK